MVKVSIPQDLTFLILDDQESMRAAMKAELKKIGFSGPFHEATYIKDAWDILNSENIDFIFSDWNLIDEIGLDFLKQVRGEKKFQDTPFIMITTEDDVTNILEAVQLGASNYIVKPWQTKDFLERLISAWSKHQSK